MIRILIADDHEVVRRGIRLILQEGFVDSHIGEASDTDSLIKESTEAHWDIVISDLNMPGGGGMNAISRILQEKPSQPILILSIYPEEQYAIKAFHLGAAGYLNKDAATDELLNAVKVILSGRRYIQSSISDLVSEDLRNRAGLLPHEFLSDREFQVMSKLVSGHTITEIANVLALSPNTVSTYRSRILVKMDMRTNADLIRYAVLNQLTSIRQAE